MIKNLNNIFKWLLNKLFYIKKKILFFYHWQSWQIKLYVLGYKQNFKIFSHLTFKEKLFLYKSALKLKPGSVIVEIGSYLGASTTFLAAGAKERRSLIYCVDTWKNEAMSEGSKDTFSKFEENTKRFNNIIPLRGKSAKIGRKFNKKINLLFIDGDHSYKAVKLDLKTWLPHTKKGTVLIMHDYGWAKGVIKCVKEIIRPIEKSNTGHSFENMYVTVINSDHFSKNIEKTYLNM